MNLLDNNTTICMSCSKRVNNNEIIRKYKQIGICSDCYKKLIPVPFDSAFEGRGNINYVLSAYYYNATLKNLIYRYKFNGEWLIGELFSDMLFDYLKTVPVIHDFDFITAVPLSHKRFLERGYNQAEIIAKSVSGKLDIPYVSCIYKAKHTSAQSLLKSKERFLNIKNAYIADAEKVKDKKIILIDDIYTTGATINECARELKNKNASDVIGVSLAIASKKKSE